MVATGRMGGKNYKGIRIVEIGRQCPWTICNGVSMPNNDLSRKGEEVLWDCMKIWGNQRVSPRVTQADDKDLHTVAATPNHGN